MNQLAYDHAPIILIGLPGSGKTTVGRILACRMKRPFIDLDERIVKLAKRSINELFDDGETVFRNWEQRALGELLAESITTQSSPPAPVVASGGGIVERPVNRELLAQNACVVYLEVDLKTLRRRLDGNSQRPLLRRSPNTLETLARRRTPWYEALSDLTVRASDNTAAQIATTIKNTLECEQLRSSK